MSKPYPQPVRWGFYPPHSSTMVVYESVSAFVDALETITREAPQDGLPRMYTLHAIVESDHAYFVNAITARRAGRENRDKLVAERERLSKDSASLNIRATELTSLLHNTENVFSDSVRAFLTKRRDEYKAERCDALSRLEVIEQYLARG